MSNTNHQDQQVPLGEILRRADEPMPEQTKRVAKRDAPTPEKIVGEQVALVVNQSTAQTVAIINECREVLNSLEARLIQSAAHAKVTLENHILFGADLEEEAKRIRDTVRRLEVDRGV